MRNKTLGIFFFFLFLHSFVWAVPSDTVDTLTIDSYRPSYPLALHLRFAQDVNQADSGQDVHLAVKQLRWSALTEIDSFLPKTWYVGKLVVRSKLDSDIDLGLYISQAEVQLFDIPHSNVRMQTGFYQSIADNDELFLRSSVVPVHIKANTVTVVYTRFKAYKPLTVNPRLMQYKQVLEEMKPAERLGLTFRFFFFGGFLLVLFISLIVLFFNWKGFHLFYSLYVLFVGIINGSYELFFDLVAISGRYKFLMAELSGGFAWVAYVLFIQYFLLTKRVVPFWHRILNLLLVAVVVYIVFTVVVLGLLHDSVLYHRFRNVYTLVLFALTLPTFVRLLFSKNKLIVIVISGGLITLLSWIIYLSLQIYGYKDINIVRAGQLIEVFLFGMAIAIRIADVNKENELVQRAMIAQLEEKKLFQERLNKELEEKVQERTNELLHRNAELLMQSEENKVQNEQLHYANDEITRQKEKIEYSHKQMTNSIVYAKRIQRAVLWKAFSEVGAHEMFIYITPRDIVSGDFFYVREFQHQLYLAVADCTGHGVPGAFMSILGITLIDEIIRSNHSGATAVLLDELRNQLKEALQQKGELGEQRDGMDMALCSINNQTLELTFSGALRPCWILRNENKADNSDYTLFTLAPDRMPIGVHYKERPFSEQKFQLQKGDTLYLFTDGYYSQFASTSDEQIHSTGFKKLLIQIAALPLALQKQVLIDQLLKWKGDRNQTDDILVMGFRV